MTKLSLSESRKLPKVNRNARQQLFATALLAGQQIKFSDSYFEPCLKIKQLLWILRASYPDLGSILQEVRRTMEDEESEIDLLRGVSQSLYSDWPKVFTLYSLYLTLYHTVSSFNDP